MTWPQIFAELFIGLAVKGYVAKSKADVVDASTVTLTQVTLGKEKQHQKKSLSLLDL